MPAKKPEGFIPEKEFPEGHTHYGKPRCQAWSYNNGRQCLAIAITGSKVCRVHGGKSLKGIAHPNYKTGKYVNSLPKRTLQHYQAVSKNPDYLKLQDDIFLLDARLLELTSKLDGDSSFQIFSLLEKANAKLEQAQGVLIRSGMITDEEQKKRVRDKANTDFMEAIAEISRLIKSGAKEWYIWNDITGLMEKRRRLVETERKLLVDMELLVKFDDFAVLLDAIMESIRANVSDNDVRQKIQQEFIKLTS